MEVGRVCWKIVGQCRRCFRRHLGQVSSYEKGFSSLKIRVGFFFLLEVKNRQCILRN